MFVLVLVPSITLPNLSSLYEKLTELYVGTAPDFYVASAICFFKALKVYPAPAELAQIYQKTQPPAVFALVMELLSLE